MTSGVEIGALLRRLVPARGRRAEARAEAWGGACDACALNDSPACLHCALDISEHIGERHLDLRAFGRAVKQQLHRVVPVDRLVLLLVEGDTFTVSDGSRGGPLSEVPNLARACRSGVTQVTESLEGVEASLFGQRFRSAAFVVVASPKRTVGVLALGWRDADAARRVDLAAAERFAASLFPAVSTTLLYKRARDAEYDAHLLVDAVSALSSKLTVEEVSKVACLHARKIARAKTAKLAMVETDSSLHVLSANPGSAHPANQTFRPTESVTRAIDDQEVVVEASEKRLSVYLPIRKEGMAQGVLVLDYPADTAEPSARVLGLCGAIATQTAVALERAERSDELQRLAITDSLTGLGNRRQVLHDLQREMARSVRKGEPLSIAMVDLDHFKSYNDEHGHLAGDRHLASFGHFLETRLRAMDAAGRYGGEEFLLVLPGTGSADAFSAIDRLRRDWSRGVLPSTFSAGIAEVRPDDTWMDLIMRADVALYRAKAAGRNRVETAEGDLVTLTAIEGGGTAGTPGVLEVPPLHSL